MGYVQDGSTKFIDLKLKKYDSLIKLIESYYVSIDEYESARASTLNAHYTSPTVINAIYDGLENLGFKTGNILEPSMGIGNFFGMLPENRNNFV